MGYEGRFVGGRKMNGLSANKSVFLNFSLNIKVRMSSRRFQSYLEPFLL